MSRIGNKPIGLPSSVVVNTSEGGKVHVKGPKGSLDWVLPTCISLSVEAGVVHLSRGDDSRDSRAKHGLSRAIVANMVKGVESGFVKDLEIQGVGFKAQVQGDVLNLALGFSHPILFRIPAGVKVSVADNTKVKVEGIDRQVVGQVASDIRSYYPPEPYKGKGIRYAGEFVKRKEGKTVQ
jgi:large subunit ribosomal protein L6